MIKLAVAGCCGRMGMRVIALAGRNNDFELTVALEVKGHPKIGQDIHSIKISDNADELKNADCLIDFTTADATINNLASMITLKKPMVIATTGLSKAQIQKIEESAKTIPIVFAPNMSIGVNLIFKLLKQAAKVLKNYHVKITEIHHRHKKDAPSGTAKKMAEIIRDSGIQLNDSNITSIREGEIIGDHQIIFESNVDKITIAHSAKTRDIFAQGALDAAKWIVNKPVGLYNMQDVIGA